MKRFLLASLTLHFLASFAIGQVTKDALPAYLKGEGTAAAKKARDVERQKLDKQLAAAKRGKINPRLTKMQGEWYDGEIGPRSLTFPSTKERTDYTKSTSEELKSLDRQPLVPLLPILKPHKMVIGEVGMLRGAVWAYDSQDNSRKVTIVRVIDADKSLVRMGAVDDYRVDFVLHGGTRGLTDGRTYDIGNDCFEVIGTTMPLASTVFEVKPLDVAALLKDGK